MSERGGGGCLLEGGLYTKINFQTGGFLERGVTRRGWLNRAFTCSKQSGHFSEQQ